MKIILCLDYSSFTENILRNMQLFVRQLVSSEIIVLHIIDERLFYATTGYETQLGDDLNSESKILKDLCVQYLGDNVKYLEEYGIPALRIDEVMSSINADVIVIGSHTHSGLEQMVAGSVADHLLHKNKKPILIIPSQ